MGVTVATMSVWRQDVWEARFRQEPRFAEFVNYLRDAAQSGAFQPQEIVGAALLAEYLGPREGRERPTVSTTERSTDAR
jgi:hypothetical protein